MSDAAHDTPEATAHAADLALLASAAARSVAPHLRHVWRTATAVETKADAHDPVTVHDRAVEGALHTLLAHMVPASRVLGEEKGEATLPDRPGPFPPGFTDVVDLPTSPEVQGALRRVATLGPRVRWIVDPIDGTANFAAGLPWFNTSIGVELDGRVVAGAVCAPVLGQTFVADLASAWVEEGGSTTALHAVGATREREALLVSYHPGLRFLEADPDLAVEHEVRLARAHQTMRRLGACALDLAMVAGGWASCVLGMSFRPWDVAAGIHLVRMAGGRVRNEAFDTDLPDGLRPGIVACVGTMEPVTALAVMDEVVARSRRRG